ncbi:MAG: flavodoxin family protein [Tissierellia bacterium]|nr:flavodoxin family protein [Tissierellia bacterium]
MKNKITAFMGSPRKNHNTEKMLDLFIQKKFSDDDFEKIDLKNLNFKYCISCYGCATKPYCIVKDDFTSIYEKIDQSDIVIFATPIYFNSVSALSKMCIDRMQVYWSRKYIQKEKLPRNKLGIGLINGGAPAHPKQFLGSELVFDHFFAAIGCSEYSFYEISNTDEHPLNKDNQKLLSLLQSDGGTEEN